MAKKAVSKKEIVKEIEKEIAASPVVGVLPLTQAFSNGELNILRDKINELIERA